MRCFTVSDLISSWESTPQTYRHTTLIYKLNYLLFAYADLDYSLSDIWMFFTLLA